MNDQQFANLKNRTVAAMNAEQRKFYGITTRFDGERFTLIGFYKDGLIFHVWHPTKELPLISSCFTYWRVTQEEISQNGLRLLPDSSSPASA